MQITRNSRIFLRDYVRTTFQITLKERIFKQGIPKEQGAKMVRITGFGNPLLDITVKIPDNSLVEKYNLNADDQKEITDTKIKELLKDISM